MGHLLLLLILEKPATTKMADLHLKVKPGMDAALANGLLKVIIEKDFIDEAFIQERANGFEEVKEYVSSLDLKKLQK